MSAKLKKLKEASIQASEQRQLGSGYGSKKKYFLQNIDLIIELIEIYGVKYAEILKAMSGEGVELNYVYFCKLIAEAKKARQTSPEAQTNTLGSPPSRPVLIQSTEDKKTMGAEQKEEISPEKAAYIAEKKRIKSLSIGSKEQRSMLVAAAEAYLRTQNPLDRK